MVKSAHISKTVVVVFSTRVQGTAVKWRGEFSWELKGIESSHHEAYLQVDGVWKEIPSSHLP
jgi:hypothetical protein